MYDKNAETVLKEAVFYSSGRELLLPGKKHEIFSITFLSRMEYYFR
jgi:hypothetical protein